MPVVGKMNGASPHRAPAGMMRPSDKDGERIQARTRAARTPLGCKVAYKKAAAAITATARTGRINQRRDTAQDYTGLAPTDSPIAAGP